MRSTGKQRRAPKGETRTNDDQIMKIKYLCEIQKGFAKNMKFLETLNGCKLGKQNQKRSVRYSFSIIGLKFGEINNCI